MLPTCKINYNKNVDNSLITTLMQICNLVVSFCEYVIIKQTNGYQKLAIRTLYKQQIKRNQNEINFSDRKKN